MHLVTGGAGYFGDTLVQKLLARGERVRIFDLNRPQQAAPGVELVQADIRDAAAVRAACAGITHVHHNVAQVPLAKDRRSFWSVNRDGTRNLLQAALEAGARKVVYTSSSAVFGVPAANPVTEETPPRPAEAYGQAKLAGETLCAEQVAQGLDVTVIRPRTIMGHGRLGIFQILFEWIYSGANVPVLGRGDNVYQFVHADDLAEACVRAAGRPGPALYNIGAERFGTMRETLQGLLDHARTGSRIRSVPLAPTVLAMQLTSRLGLSPLGPYHALMYGRSLYFDIGKARRELGWQPRYSNVEMFCESYDWYCRHRARILAGTGGSHHQSAVRQGVMRLLRYVL
ncbi:MAG: NAD-dependent epimerase/dehydratase family protein [Candidatus Lambdaproteobacteria bacterium]|nr:NAD-dependent epimerase/dehydratase family protein [Candidatus Lambdaproteobacteria bacterium]